MRLLLSLAAWLLLGGSALAAPAQVVLIRHAEKPLGADEGTQLSPKGFRRAEALVKFFQSNPAVKRYGLPAAIYAAAPKHEDSSVRSIQTVTPLSHAIGVAIDDRFTRGQTNKIVRDIMEDPAYDGRMVLVCWQHGNLVEIAQNLAAYNASSASVTAQIPERWPDGTFDRAWVLDLKAGKVLAFKNLPQRLLPGDSEK